MSCSSLVGGLTLADCNYMASIGIVDQGVNSFSDNGYAWVGSDGPNTFTFVNSADNASITLVLWIGSRWLNVAQPYISYSLAVGQSVTISLANNFSGGFAGLYDGLTPLVSGLISNTWGEFSTGNWATIDVSREVNMGGNGMSINLDGCTSHMSKCVFQCSSVGIRALMNWSIALVTASPEQIMELIQPEIPREDALGSTTVDPSRSLSMTRIVVVLLGNLLRNFWGSVRWVVRELLVGGIGGSGLFLDEVLVNIWRLQC